MQSDLDAVAAKAGEIDVDAHAEIYKQFSAKMKNIGPIHEEKAQASGPRR